MGSILAIHSGLRDFIYGAPRHSLNWIKDHADEPGVYIIFTADGELLRIGSSLTSIGRRVWSQLRDVRELEARRIATERNVSAHISCDKCHGNTLLENPEFKAILDSIPKKLEIAYLPGSQIEKCGISIRQLEGFFLWAGKPPLNSESDKNGQSGLNCSVDDPLRIGIH